MRGIFLSEKVNGGEVGGDGGRGEGGEGSSSEGGMEGGVFNGDEGVIAKEEDGRRRETCSTVYPYLVMSEDGAEVVKTAEEDDRLAEETGSEDGVDGVVEMERWDLAGE